MLTSAQCSTQIHVMTSRLCLQHVLSCRHRPLGRLAELYSRLLHGADLSPSCRQPSGRPGRNTFAKQLMHTESTRLSSSSSSSQTCSPTAAPKQIHPLLHIGTSSRRAAIQTSMGRSTTQHICLMTAQVAVWDLSVPTSQPSTVTVSKTP